MTSSTPQPTSPTSPTIRALSPQACEELLVGHHVGRIAFAFHDRVDIEPVHYVYDQGWIYGRTSEGSKLLTIAHNPWVAFEVDDVRGLFDWESVVARGSFHRVDPNGTPREMTTAIHAANLLRRILPETLTAADPLPFRDVLFRISVDALTGRAASSGPMPAASRDA